MLSALVFRKIYFCAFAIVAIDVKQAEVVGRRGHRANSEKAGQTTWEEEDPTSSVTFSSQLNAELNINLQLCNPLASKDPQPPSPSFCAHPSVVSLCLNADDVHRRGARSAQTWLMGLWPARPFEELWTDQTL